jgi:hypothetical protein
MKYISRVPLILIATLLLGIILAYLVIFNTALRQDDNHFAIALAIPKILLGAKAVQLDEHTYLSRNADDFKASMREQGLINIDQFGSLYIFGKNDKVYTSGSHMYSSRLMVFGVPHEENQTRYTNAEYGFTFSLPDTWKNYSITTTRWEGESLDKVGQEFIKESGAQINIRHPQWTEKNIHQDIPIMVLTLTQWADLQAEKFHIGAAPINPSELGRNSKYVFALPARYNYAFPTGFEEVEEILKNNQLQTF